MLTSLYCYEISVPSTSEECLYDVVLTNPARRSGTKGSMAPTKVNELMCPGKKMYVPGPVSSLDKEWPEGMVFASVEGYGYYSGIRRVSRDGAGVFPSDGF